MVSLELDVYAAVMAAVVAALVRWYEESTPSRQHGSSYDAHRAQVPAWIPRRQAEGL